MTGYKKFSDHREIKNMSLEFFHKAPGEAIEILFDYQKQPLFKRTDLGKYLDIEIIKHNFKDFPSHYARPRSDLEGGGRCDYPPRQGKKFP